MSNELQRKLYEMEVNPPSQVWEKLSLHLDEINADNQLAQKIESAEVEPLPAAWQNIKNLLNEGNKPVVNINRRKTVATPFRRLAAAAIFIGIAIAVWLVFFNNKTADSIVTVDPVKENKIGSPTTENNQEAPTTEVATADDQPAPARKRSGSVLSSVAAIPGFATRSIDINDTKNANVSEPAEPVVVSGHKQWRRTIVDKRFKESSLDDLAFVASNSDYITMVSADGRLVKIPKQYSDIAPYLQEKSDEIEYIDLLFEESAYWKEKFREWRLKIAQSAITPSFDNFFNIVNLLRTVQE